MLAPAGTVEAFEAAVENGADAVYLGAPAANARALAKDLTFQEIAAMIDFGHRHGVKVYAAMNSLVKDGEIPTVVRTLSVLSGIGIDAVIIQDLGLFHIIKKYFPELRIHASTLMGAHNSFTVKHFTDMGFSRIVLAREMRLAEIAEAVAATNAQIEVFVHGAMCFSFSGLCLFSSYLGGKSGLRGRCVQPCRRLYSWQGESKLKSSGYFFSMNDLQGLNVLAQLKELGVSSCKIEGRMRSSHYVGVVVKAYRMALDNNTADPEIYCEADRLLAEAMGRKTTGGYFQPQDDSNLIASGHSGNIGLFVGQMGECGHGRGMLKLREDLRVGDRLRVHFEKSGERQAFNVKNMWLGDVPVSGAKKGAVISLAMPQAAIAKDCVYKVDTAESRSRQKSTEIKPAQYDKVVRAEIAKDRIRKNIALLGGPKGAEAPTRKPKKYPGRGSGTARSSFDKIGKVKSGAPESLPLPLWLKVDDLHLLRRVAKYSGISRIVVLLTPDTFRQFKRLSLSAGQRADLIWALPPLIFEADIEFYRGALVWLGLKGFLDWQISHIGQVKLLQDAATIMATASDRKGGAGGGSGKKRRGAVGRSKRFQIYGNYSLNIINSPALKTLEESGIHSGLLSLESDREIVREVARQGKFRLGITAYCFPPLFTARLAPGFLHYEKVLVSPKGEEFILRQRLGTTMAFPKSPFSLLETLQEFADFGGAYAVVDLSYCRVAKGDLENLWRRIGDKRQRRERLSSFNYGGTLY